MRLFSLLAFAMFASVAQTQAANPNPLKLLAGNYLFSINLVNVANVGDGSWGYQGGAKITSKGKIVGNANAEGPASSNYANYPVSLKGKVKKAGSKYLKLEIKTNDGVKLTQTYEVFSRYLMLRKSSMRKGGYSSTNSPLKKL
ncbi:MAG TPA: hypothetical protein VIM61_09360 [Chthoniobacterales bacterium]